MTNTIIETSEQYDAFIKKIPETFNDTVMRAILKDLEYGAPKKHAAESNGIAETTLTIALMLGAFDMMLGNTQSRFSKFLQSVRTIEKNEIEYCREAIKTDGKAHKGAMWTLEHVYWREFGNDAQVQELAEELRIIRDNTTLVKAEK